jgi:hypothetical protein
MFLGRKQMDSAEDIIENTFNINHVLAKEYRAHL